MMNRTEFFEYIKDNVLDYLPDSLSDADVKLCKVPKNNDVMQNGVTIRDRNSSFAPTIYLDGLYEQYRYGKNLDSCVGDVADLWVANAEPEFDVAVNFLTDYDSVKDRLHVSICDPEMNKERLSGKAVTMAGDFAATYSVIIAEGEGTCASTPVAENMLMDWGIGVEQLHQDALAADKHRGITLRPVDGLINSILYDREAAPNLLENHGDVQDMEGTLLCLTNVTGVDGSSMILHEDVRKQIGEVVQGDFFILPSSIHETLILKDDGSLNAHELKELVQTVNAERVSQKEQLSDKVQFCDGKTAVMENAEKRELRLEQARDAHANEAQGKGIHGKLEKAKAQNRPAEGRNAPVNKARDAAMEI